MASRTLPPHLAPAPATKKTNTSLPDVLVKQQIFEQGWGILEQKNTNGRSLNTHKDFVAVHNSVQSVCDGHNSDVIKLAANRFLDQFVSASNISYTTVK